VSSSTFRSIIEHTEFKLEEKQIWANQKKMWTWRLSHIILLSFEVFELNLRNNNSLKIRFIELYGITKQSAI
jgi:hypothetical protein